MIWNDTWYWQETSKRVLYWEIWLNPFCFRGLSLFPWLSNLPKVKNHEFFHENFLYDLHEYLILERHFKKTAVLRSLVESLFLSFSSTKQWGWSFGIMSFFMRIFEMICNDTHTDETLLKECWTRKSLLVTGYLTFASEVFLFFLC